MTRRPYRSITSQLTELEEEHSGEDGAFAELDKINKGEVAKRLKGIKGDRDSAEEAKVLKQWSTLEKQQSELKKQIKELDATLDQLAHDQYAKLSTDDIKTLVVDELVEGLDALADDLHVQMMA